MTRRYLRLLSWMLVGTLLYSQMAIAAYACPGQGSRAGMAVSAASIQPIVGMVDDAGASSGAQAGDCEGMSGAMDPSAKKLCADHCNYGHQNDQSPNLPLPTLSLTTLYVVLPTLFPSIRLQPATELSALAEASPPLSILHCRFRT